MALIRYLYEFIVAVYLEMVVIYIGCDMQGKSMRDADTKIRLIAFVVALVFFAIVP